LDVIRPATALLLVCCSSLALGEVRQADLDKASRLVFDQKYEAAARALEVAARQTGNRRETVLRILELQGVTYAQLNQEAKARAAFQQLLNLDPKRDLSGKYTAKVAKPFELAQQWAMDNPPLEVIPEPAATDGTGRVMQIAVKVKNDVLKLARKVRFNVRPEGLKWSELEVDIQGAYAAAGTDAEAVDWFAEVLGERDAVLLSIGTQRAPIREGKGAPPKEKVEAKKQATPEEPKKKVEPEPEPEKQPELVVKAPEPEGGGNAALRGAGYGAMVLGVLSLGAGVVMGLENLSTVSDVQRREAMRDPGNPNLVTGITQDLAQGLRKRAILQAQLANTFYGVGGGLMVAGVLMWFFGRDVVVVPAGGGGGEVGVALSGRF
jgi:hypothetical protein